MNAGKKPPGNTQNQNPEEIKQEILRNIQLLLEQKNVKKIYFIDDALEQDTGKEAFKAIVNSIVIAGKQEELHALPGEINFTLDNAVLPDHIDRVWDSLEPNKQIEYFENAHRIDGKPELILDLNVSNSLKSFFADQQVGFLTPTQWDHQHEQILAAIIDQSKIMVIFDQDLKLAPGRFSEQSIQGEHLIVELKQIAEDKAIMALLTHTVTEYDNELPKKAEICSRNAALAGSDFFVLAKKRLAEPSIFADGLKKVLINSHFETIKQHTVKIIENSYKKAIEKINVFDTYDFDETILKTSIKDGIWEPETIIRITDIIFENELKKLMVETDYARTVNPELKASQKYSQINFPSPNVYTPYPNKSILRHQEIYDQASSINPLRKPLENGDIFQIGELKYILVAQACDMAVRKKGEEIGLRTAKVATLLKINTITADALKRKIKDSEHYFSNKYLLNYFNSQSAEKGIVDFTDYLIVDIDFLDLCVFNREGECRINLNKLESKDYLSSIWEKRYDILVNRIKEHKAKISEIRKYFQSNQVGRRMKRMAPIMQRKPLMFTSNVSPSLIEKEFYPKFILSSSNPVENLIKIETDWTFNFSVKRIGKYKDYGATYLLERYTRHLSRIAEPHDFAGQL